MASKGASVDINALSSAWTRLQHVNQHVAASQKESWDIQRFLWEGVENMWHLHGSFERKCQEYHRAYISVERHREFMINEIQSLTNQNHSLQGELENAQKLTNVGNPRTNELGTVSKDLVERNVFLEQEIQQCRQKIRTLEARILEIQGMKEMNLSPKKIGSGSLNNYPDNLPERLTMADSKLVKSSNEKSQVCIEMEEITVVKRGRKQGRKVNRKGKNLAVLNQGLNTAA